ncbi:MAG: DNRLRE domain-containing protein, partial [Planctomycetes bacterium]|nr:DNRLRE domain-containing protein [Planctomycetota bacterium]
MGENLLPKKLFVLFFSVGLLVIPADSFAINLITLYPTDDTYVDAFTPVDSYGGSTELNVGFQDLVDQDQRCRTFLKFDMNTIPANAIIISATLELEATAYNSTMSPTAVTTHYVFPLPWSEALLNWNSPPNQPNGYIPTASDTQFISATGIYQWDVKTHVMSAYYSNIPYSVMLKVVDDEFIPGQSDFVQFRSENVSSPFTPKLMVEYYINLTQTDTPELEGPVKVIAITEPLDIQRDTTGLIHVDGTDKYGPHRETIYDLTGGPDSYSLDDKIEITFTGTIFTEERPSRIDDCDPDSDDEPSTSATFEYDSLGRLVHATSNPVGSGTDTFTDLNLDYDILGNLNYADVNHENGSVVSWTLDYDSDGNIYKRVYEKKDNTVVPPLYSGIVGYFLDNVNQLLYKTKPGALPEAT